MNFRREILLRARIVLLLVCSFMLVIIYKIYAIQFLEGEQWLKQATVAQFAYRPIAATRGNIYSDDGDLLATSLPFYSVSLDPTLASNTCFLEAIDPLSEKLASFYKDKPASYYKQLILSARKQGKKYVSIHSKAITYEEKKEMSKWPLFNKGRFKGGVRFQEQYKRYHPFQGLAKRTIGCYTETYGFGLEYAFNKALTGMDGSALYQKVVGGNWKPVAGSTMIPPLQGYDLKTTIDINLQDVTHSSLLSVLEKTSAQYGCAIVMEVATGAIKAMANLTRTVAGSYVEAYNYAVGHQGSVEPGSIFKLVSMLALLEETKWPLVEPIEIGSGRVKFCNSWMEDVHKGNQGTLTLQEIFERSSNVGMALAVHQVFGKTPQKFINYIEHLRLHQPLGIELAGEGKPYMITPKNKMWNGITLPWLSIGYNIQLTPLQLLVLYNAIANNGKMVKPMLVQQIFSSNGFIKNMESVVLNEKICADETLAKLKSMLEGTVEKGLARGIKHKFYKIAGKTGTAEKLVHGRYTNKHLTSFVGYFPTDHPRYSCIIVVDSPQGEHARFGSQVPAPIFKEIVNKISGKDLCLHAPLHKLISKASCLSVLSNSAQATDLKLLYQYLQLPIPEGLKHAEGWVEVELSATAESVKPCSLMPNMIPPVLGMSLRDAIFILEISGLHVSIEGNIHGKVCKQSLLPYKEIACNDKHIIITLQ